MDNDGTDTYAEHRCKHGQSWMSHDPVTVEFNPCDAVSIIRALREAVDPEVLRIVAQAELANA